MMYFLGTKKGRVAARQLLDIFEELELSAGDIITELEEKLENEESPITMREKLESILPSDKIDNVLHKIKRVLPVAYKKSWLYWLESVYYWEFLSEKNNRSFLCGLFILLFQSQTEATAKYGKALF